MNSQNLFPILVYVLNKIFKCDFKSELKDIPDFSTFSVFYCGIIISILSFPMLILRDMTSLIKINSYGIYCVFILLISVIIIGIISLSNTQFAFEYTQNSSNSNKRYLYLFGDDPHFILGTFSLGFFSHSFALPILKNNEYQKNNKRDLFIGYLFVLLTYLVVGILGYIGFSGKSYEVDFKDNWFRFFPDNDIFIIVLRLLNVIQLLSIFPILVYIIRIQFFGTFFNSSYPGKLYIICFSLSLLLLCLIILIFLGNNLGELISYIGAIIGLFLIYMIPLVVNIIYYIRKHPKNLDLLNARKYNNLTIDETDTDDLKVTIEEEEVFTDNENDIDYHGISEKPKNKFKEILFYISQGLLFLIGLFTVFIQFKHLNLFNIHFRS